MRFERRTSTDDGYGNVRGAWATIVPAVAADVVPIKGGETVQAERLSGHVVYEIRVRGSAAMQGVLPSDRAVDQRSGDIFNIRAIVNPDRVGRWLVMTAETGVADG